MGPRRISAAGALAIMVAIAACTTPANGPKTSTSAAPPASVSGDTVPAPIVPGPVVGPIPRPTAGGSPVGPVPTGMQDFYAQQISWGACPPFAESADSELSVVGVQCANLIVPLDHQDPAGGTVALAVMRRPATGSKRIGSLVVNFGGPGGSGLPQLAYAVSSGLVPEPLAERFDLVTFDVRGVGGSRPQIRCLPDAEMDAHRAVAYRATTPEELAVVAAANERIIAACLAHTGRDNAVEATAFLTHIGTADAARDLDVLRSVLGDDALSYVGISYGSVLGAAYADQFPATLRAMVIDSGGDLDTVEPAVLAERAAARQAAFDAFADWCTSLVCALGGDPAQAAARLQDLLRPLVETPLPVGDGRVLTFDGALTGVEVALGTQTSWGYLRVALEELAGGNGTRLLAAADYAAGRTSDGRYLSDSWAQEAIWCADVSRPATDLAAVTIAPFEQPGFARDHLVPCAGWPTPQAVSVAAGAVVGLPRLLSLAVRGDPAVPLVMSERQAARLGAELFVIEGYQHTSFFLNGLKCADDVGTAYLLDLTLPTAPAPCAVPAP